MGSARMTQTQLIRHLAERCDVNNKVARAFLEELAQTALQETRKKGTFVLPGIGRLVKSSRKARMARIPAKTVVKSSSAGTFTRASIGRKDLAFSSEDDALKTLAEVFSVL